MPASECTSSTADGCRCWEHDPGLSAYCPDEAKPAYERILAPLRKTATLKVVTLGPSDEAPCNGSMTCDCRSCQADRAKRLNTTHTSAHQPWMPRPARRAA